MIKEIPQQSPSAAILDVEKALIFLPKAIHINVDAVIYVFIPRIFLLYHVFHLKF